MSCLIVDGSARLHGEEQTSHEETSDEDTDNEETSGLEALLLYLEIMIHSTAYMNGIATMWGVFKAHAFFFCQMFLRVIKNTKDPRSNGVFCKVKFALS